MKTKQKKSSVNSGAIAHC